jgi:hypothetical protein
MRTSTWVLVGLATFANAGLWFWFRTNPAGAPSAAAACAIAQQPGRSVAGDQSPKATQYLTSGVKPQSRSPLSQTDAKTDRTALSTNGAAPVPDQPWLSGVRDNVLQIAQSPQFFDKIVIADTQCQGSTCTISGSTQTSSDGQRHGNADVAKLMGAFNNGQIAGGDTDRTASLASIGTSASGNGVDFALTITSNGGTNESVANPCQAVFDLWNQMHPGEWPASSSSVATGLSSAPNNSGPGTKSNPPKGSPR